MATLTLLREGLKLADPCEQRAVLTARNGQTPFRETLRQHGLPALQAAGIQVLQVNLGKLCNQTCRHCHVDAGPDRRETMTRETMALCLRALEKTSIPTVDITG